MFIEVITTITSKVEFTDDDLKVVEHVTDIMPGGLPEPVAYAIALGGCRALDHTLSDRLGNAASVVDDEEGE